MADKSEKNEFNVAGKFYVDSQCIGCALCTSTAEGLFATTANKFSDFQKFSGIGKTESRKSRTEAVRDFLSLPPPAKDGNEREHRMNDEAANPRPRAKRFPFGGNSDPLASA